MSNFNSLTQVGRLTRDPEERSLPDGGFLCEFTVASNRGKGDREETLFMDWTAWGKAAETIVKFFEKGKPILVTGRLKTDRWEKDGQNRSKVCGTVSEFAFVGGKSEDQGDAPQPPKASADADPIPF